MKFWDKLDKGNKRLIVCTPRQVGKSLGFAVFSLKSAAYNTAPCAMDKKTRIGIISATEEQSKKVMDEIRRLIEMGDEQVSRLTGGKIRKYFTNLVDSSKSAANNKSQITFTNGCTIICLPPTNRVRGYSFSYVFCDEFAFFEDDEIFGTSIEPTVRQTGGGIILTSTPNGQHGMFFKLFDPDENNSYHEYERMWLHYTCIDSEEEIKRLEEKKVALYSIGKEKQWEQEYEAKFTVAMSSFFESDKVDRIFDKSRIMVYSYPGVCDMGVDFGMVNSQTVVTISEYVDGHINVLYQHAYDYGKDDNLINDIASLREQFPNIQRIIPDQCAEGYFKIQEMQAKGWNVQPMSFKKDKINKYFALRSRIYKGDGLLHCFPCKELEYQLKGMVEEQGVTGTKIHKPSGGMDDRVDSLVMSCFFFLEEQNCKPELLRLDVPENKTAYNNKSYVDRLLGR